jgi:hypothetical protein
MEYALYGITTEDLKPIARSIFMLVKPQIDTNYQRFLNGNKGGRPNQSETEAKPNNNQSETKPEPNVNVNVNENVNENELKPPTPLKGGAVKFDFSFVCPELAETFQDWLSYKKAKKQTYRTQRSLKSCYSHLMNLAGGNAETAKRIVEQTFANNWDGLFELKESRKPVKNSSLGVGEWMRPDGTRTYGSGTTTVPDNAPPRPSASWWWNDELKQWNM